MCAADPRLKQIRRAPRPAMANPVPRPRPLRFPFPGAVPVWFPLAMASDSSAPPAMRVPDVDPMPHLTGPALRFTDCEPSAFRGRYVDCSDHLAAEVAKCSSSDDHACVADGVVGALRGDVRERLEAARVTQHLTAGRTPLAAGGQHRRN